MRLLDAVNLILPKLGEHEVTSLTVRHPTLAIILPEIDNKLRNVLLRGWWFNEYPYTAHPDSEGKITLGSTTLSFVPIDTPAVLRGMNLYDPNTLSYIWTTSVSGIVTEYIEYDNIPYSAQQYVLYDALVDIYTSDIGLEKEVQLWQTRTHEAYSALLAEHLRQRKYSLRDTRQFYKLARARRA